MTEISVTFPANSWGYSHRIGRQGCLAEHAGVLLFWCLHYLRKQKQHLIKALTQPLDPFIDLASHGCTSIFDSFLAYLLPARFLPSSSPFTHPHYSSNTPHILAYNLISFTMSKFSMTELPTASQLAQARESLGKSEVVLKELSQKIDDAERELAQIIQITRQKIDTLNAEKTELQQEIALTLAYVSPIRRLPNELLRAIFLINFEDDARCAWTFSSVCTLWRRISLQTPRLWSRIRVDTTQNSSADIIRLWLERSGLTCPLDIEISLQVSQPPSPHKAPRRGRSLSYPAPLPSPPLSWAGMPIHHHTPVNIGGNGGGVVHYISTPGFPGVPLVVSPSPPASQASTPGPSAQVARAVTHWGHIAMFYLTQQMERWERFVFKFDKTFPSMSALMSITGE